MLAVECKFSVSCFFNLFLNGWSQAKWFPSHEQQQGWITFDYSFLHVLIHYFSFSPLISIVQILIWSVSTFDVISYVWIILFGHIIVFLFPFSFPWRPQPPLVWPTCNSNGKWQKFSLIFSEHIVTFLLSPPLFWLLLGLSPAGAQESVFCYSVRTPSGGLIPSFPFPLCCLVPWLVCFLLGIWGCINFVVLNFFFSFLLLWFESVTGQSITSFNLPLPWAPAMGRIWNYLIKHNLLIVLKC